MSIAAGEHFPGELIRIRWSPEAVASLGVDETLSEVLMHWWYVRNPAFSPLT